MSVNFDIDALRTIVAGVDANSFARAAVELGRSQSAVSMQLKKLEQQAGTPLFVRKGRGLVPTDAGEALLDYARRIIALNDDAARVVGASVPAQTVRIGLPQDFFDDVMPMMMKTVSKSQPDVHLEMRAGNNHQIADAINAGRLHAAIAFFPKSAGAKGELLCELPVHWLAGSTLPEPGDEPVPLVLFNRGCLFRAAALTALDRADRRWRAVLTTPSLGAIWAGLRAGLGIGVRVGHAVPDDIIDVGQWSALPPLPAVELRLLGSPEASPAVGQVYESLRQVVAGRICLPDTP